LFTICFPLALYVCLIYATHLFILALEDSSIQALKIWDIINTLKEFSISMRHGPSCLPSTAPFTTIKNLKSKKKKKWRHSFPH